MLNFELDTLVFLLLVFSRASRLLGGRPVVARGLAVVLGFSTVRRGITKTY